MLVRDSLKFQALWRFGGKWKLLKFGLTKLDYQRLWLPQWDEMMGNEEKSEDGDSIRMLTSQVKKYLNFAETKT